MSTDDWRAVDWPKIQVERIDQALRVFDRRLVSVEMGKAIHEDERYSRLLVRLKELERLAGVKDSDFSAPIGGRKYQRDLDDELDNIPDVHGRGKLIGPVHAHLDAPCTDQCFEPEDQHVLKAGVVHRASEEPNGTPVRVVPSAEAARRSTLELAEQRVREYMTGHFSTASVEGVVRALRGKTDPPKIWLEP